MKRSDGARGVGRAVISILRMIAVALLLAPIVALALLLFTHDLSWRARIDLRDCAESAEACRE
ncbi:MAG: hypothetical protein R3C16_05375 [Hyphomonadaceae bacterium]